MSDFQKAKQYVFNLLGSDLSPHFIYHDLSHTLDVYKAATRLGEMAQLDDNEMFLLKTAALFHDVGMIYQIDQHEEKSAEVAREVLPGFGYSHEDIDLVNSMILATKLPQTPPNRLAEFLCDADLDYLGRDDFFLNGARLHLEWQRMKTMDVPFDEWISIEKSFLLSHRYFSKEARMLRDEGKQRNLAQLEGICEFGNRNEDPNPF